MPENTARTDETRRSMRISTLDGLFAVQYTTLTGGPFLTAFLLTLGASTFQIGLVASLPMLGGLLQPAGAEVIRRRGGRRKGVLLAAALIDALLWIASVAAVVWMPPLRAVAFVLLVLAVQQSANAFTGAAWTSWMSDLVPAQLRGRYFGMRNFITNAFGAATAIGAGVLVRLAPADPVPVFLALILLGVLFRLISIHFLTRQSEPMPAISERGGFLRQVRLPLANPGFRRYVMFSAAWGFAVFFSSPFYAVYMLQEASVSVSAVMTFTALGTISNLVGQRVWGPLCDRYGDRQVMKMAGLSAAIQPIWWLLTGPTGAGYYLMAVLSMTGGFAWGGYMLATGNLMMRLAPETGKTSFFAIQAAFGGVSGAAGPIIGGMVAGLFTGGYALFPIWLFDGLKSLFFIGFVLRVAAWLMIRWVPEPVERPRLRATLVIRDTVRTLNPAQGFSPLLHVFIPSVRSKKAVSRGLSRRRRKR